MAKTELIQIFWTILFTDFCKCISVILQLLFCISVSAASTDLNSLKSNWPPMVQKRDGTNRGIQLNSFGPKAWRHRPTGVSNWPPLVQSLNVSNIRVQLTSFGAKTWRHQQGDPTDLLWCKSVTSPTGGSKWPPLVQKHDVTNKGIQMTPFHAKMWRHHQWDQTDLLYI